MYYSWEYDWHRVDASEEFDPERVNFRENIKKAHFDKLRAFYGI